MAKRSLVYFDGDTVTVVGNIKYSPLLDSYEISPVHGLWAGGREEFFNFLKNKA